MRWSQPSAKQRGSLPVPALDLEDLYREILLDHYRNPRNHGHVEVAASCAADGANPLCGDEIHLEVVIADNAIADIRFTGNGCSISQASTSLMTEHVKGQPIATASAAAHDFEVLMRTGEPPAESALGDIEALAGVAKFPARVKCASLAWKTLEQALADAEAHGTPNGHAPTVSTDERTAD